MSTWWDGSEVIGDAAGACARKNVVLAAVTMLRRT